ncbi:KHG/KDPG aldolase isoform X3 [Rosa chinensis]|uniref:KHG/KDPG aldolase isoform X3 n=1 Tax=Rosa chinensis TaxID=74649 RepID=UPI001AD8F566|nr:KHG/KDPG aldolase isoform X3 [Rosa chinensis]
MATAKSLIRSPFASLSSSFMFKSSPPPLPCRPHRLRVCCSSIQKTLTEVDSSGVIACLRANSAELAFEAACAALEGGISVLEIVMSTPGVFEVLQQLVHIYPTRVLGVGTVLNIEDAERAVTAGAKFFMSPVIVKILSAYDAGAKIVKIYPVSALGGIHYISAIKKPFPHISMVASQGITIGSAGEYIAKGASSVVLSDAIFDKEAMGQKNFNRIHQLANMAALQCKEAVDRKKNLMLINNL